MYYYRGVHCHYCIFGSESVSLPAIMWKTRHYLLFLLWLIIWTSHPIQFVYAYSACAPDAQCIAHRICAFGSESMYNRVRSYLFEVTACGNCVDTCENNTCACPLTGAVQIELAQIEHGINTTTLGYCDQSAICRNERARAALGYQTDNAPCEAAFVLAQTWLIKLCGHVNNRCCNGTCTTYQRSVSPGICYEEEDSHKGNTIFIIAYLVVLSYLYLNYSALLKT